MVVIRWSALLGMVSVFGVADIQAKLPGVIKESSKEKSQEQPLRIVADEMDCDQKTNICTAKGNAFAQKMNDPKNQTISAHTLIAHFKKKDRSAPKDNSSKAQEPSQEGDTTQGVSGNTSLDKIEAVGDVVMADTSSIIKCDRGIYYAETETADLYDNVSLTQGKNELTGTHGHANMKDETYSIKNENGRVEGLFYQKDKSSPGA